MENSEPVGLNMQLQWVGDLASPPTPVNQMMILPDAPVQPNADSGGHVLMLGNVTLPVVVGEITPQIAAELSSQPLPVMPVARVFLTTARLREFHEVIGRHLAQLD
ncbi:MAG: hypothetical protein LBE05_05660 [Microbacterium sp.]|nr:hypothetical protein [Microbacterium sp.]